MQNKLHRVFSMVTLAMLAVVTLFGIVFSLLSK